MIEGHTLSWVINHELWHYSLSICFSLLLLLVVLRRNLVTLSPANLTYTRIYLISDFLLWVSLALVWHYILDLEVITDLLRFGW